jgi:hypothetical protein
MHLLIDGISDYQYGLNRWGNHSMRHVNYNDTYRQVIYLQYANIKEAKCEIQI